MYTVQVHVGFAVFHCGCVEYVSSSDSKVPLIVGLVVGLGGALVLAIIGVIVYCCCCYKKRHGKTIEDSQQLDSNPSGVDKMGKSKGRENVEETSVDDERRYMRQLPPGDYSSRIDSSVMPETVA